MTTPAWLRTGAIVIAGLTSVATSVIPDYRVEAPPEQKFLERDGVVVHTYGCRRGFHAPSFVQHLDAMFVVKNERSDSVTFSTASARLVLDRLEFENDIPVTFSLKPGEARKVYARFDLKERNEFLVQAAMVRIRLGAARLQTGGELDFTRDLTVENPQRWED